MIVVSLVPCHLVGTVSEALKGWTVINTLWNDNIPDDRHVLEVIDGTFVIF